MHSETAATEPHRKLSDPHAPRARGREHEQLEAFVGAWRVTGRNAPSAPGGAGAEVTGEQIYEWLPGRFFLASRWHRRFEGGEHVGTGVLGYDPDARSLYSHHFDNLGFARRYRVAVRGGRVWTIAGPWERAAIAFDPGGDRYSETWEVTRDGVRWRLLCELWATRAQQSREHLVRAYYGAYQAGDRAAVERLLAGGFRFTSPHFTSLYDDGLDAAAYFARCWPGHEQVRSLTIEDLTVAGDQALVTYLLVTRDGAHIRNTERLVFDGDRIASVEVFLGATRGEDRAVGPTRRE